MADWSKPALTDTYANFLSYLNSRLNDVALGNDPANTTLTNQPTNTIRWNSASNLFEKYNGTTWAALSTGYAISITGNAATATSASSVAWSGVTGTPTTLSGYGISDGITATAVAATYATIASLSGYAPSASPTLSGTVNLSGGSGSLNIGGNITRFESTEQSCPSAQGTTTVSHGGPRAPDLTLWYLRCKTADAGYAVGTELVLGGSDAGDSRGYRWYSTATQCSFQSTGGGIDLRNTSYGLIAATYSSWRLVCRAFWF